MAFSQCLWVIVVSCVLPDSYALLAAMPRPKYLKVPTLDQYNDAIDEALDVLKKSLTKDPPPRLTFDGSGELFNNELVLSKVGSIYRAEICKYDQDLKQLSQCKVHVDNLEVRLNPASANNNFKELLNITVKFFGYRSPQVESNGYFWHFKSLFETGPTYRPFLRSKISLGGYEYLSQITYREFASRFSQNVADAVAALITKDRSSDKKFGEVLKKQKMM